MTELIPSIDGPKLSPFPGAINNIQLQEYLGPATTRIYPEDKPLSHSFRVNIEGEEYRLTVFRFFSLDQLRSFGPNECDRDDQMRYTLDPFYAECRAFGLLGEKEENGLISVRCYGYAFLPEAIEHQMQKEFNVSDWGRQPGDEQLPLRAIVKDYICSELCRSEQLYAMSSNLGKLNDMGIFNMNVREENYAHGLLIDFSIAITVPHLQLLPELRSMHDICEDMHSDCRTFQTMAYEVLSRNGDDPGEAFTTLSPRNIARASLKSASIDNWETEENDDEWEPEDIDDETESEESDYEPEPEDIDYETEPEESDDEPELEETDEGAVPPLNNSASLVEDLSAPQKSKYLQLLSQVISAAEEARFLRQDNFDMSAMKVDIGDVGGTGEDDEDNTKLRSDLGAGYKKMIRAAGELYVFELLSTNLGLPLCRAHWKSKIRQYVTEHPKYAKMEMEPCLGGKTASLVYSDYESALTTLLINEGYLEKRWTGRNPTYYIDVKTTVGGCGDPFSMSNSQDERMRFTTNGPGGTFPHDRIYIIFRVYNFGKKSIGCAIYVDPEALRIKGALKLSRTWAVVPGRLT
ncbi:kinetochore Sim4 complex subunit FTA2-domain-containing protein [Xylaria scruposa]|nr:kinetochore Sim4 complex subunit FTA2-domain-containing protein [Xylaria scruposa]